MPTERTTGPRIELDPVCGMRVNPETARWKSQFEGKSFYFCTESCKRRFDENPKVYSDGSVLKRMLSSSVVQIAPASLQPRSSKTAQAGAGKPKPGKYICPIDPDVVSERPTVCPKCGMALEQARPAAPSVEYVCPMHPEVVRNKPGACPICGMTLEPRSASAKAEDDSELRSMTQRFWLGAALTAPLLILSMAGSFIRFLAIRWRGFAWLQFALASPVVLWSGLPFFERGLASIKNRKLNMFTLIAMGTATAYLFSLLALFLPGFGVSALNDENGRPQLYFEVAAAITVLVLLGQVLELRARKHTSYAIRALLDLNPKTAKRILPSGVEEEVSLELVNPGDRLRVRPGEKIPADGIVVEGSGFVDEAMLTGESMPVPKSKNAQVIGGTINGNGWLIVEAQRTGNDTMLAQIIRLVSDAQRSRAPIQRLADTVSAYFVPAVILVSLGTFVVWFLAGGKNHWVYAVVNSVAVLIIACPCALGLATPMAIMMGTGKAAQAGVLFRDAAALETLNQVDTMVFDKTGTLTEGRPEVLAIETGAGWSRGELLTYGASVERLSEHPLADAVVRRARGDKLDLLPVENFRSVTGQGVSGVVNGHLVQVGSENYIASQGIDSNLASTFQGKAQSVIFLAIDHQFAGMIAIADPIKETTPESIAALKSDGLRLLMLTGDNRATACAMAKLLGIDEVEAEVLPESKSHIVKRLQGEGRKVAMAGDGINDAPALAQADVGVAMGTGTDIAMESAGVTLLKGDLAGIVKARKLSHAVVRNIKQNLFFAFVYNALGVPIAAGVLYPLLGVLLSPMLAAAAMSFSSVSVISNSLRLRNLKL